MGWFSSGPPRPLPIGVTLDPVERESLSLTPRNTGANGVDAALGAGLTAWPAGSECWATLANGPARAVRSDRQSELTFGGALATST